MTGWLIAFLAVLLAAVAVFVVNKLVSRQANPSRGCFSAIAMLLFTIAIFLMLISFSFYFFNELGPSWPFSLFVVIVGLFVLAELYFIIYFYFFRVSNWVGKMQTFLHHLGVNPLKGWGGETASDFYNGMGVMVAVGVNLVFTNLSPNFWWAGQLAAIISVMSGAAWVQRYVTEGPEAPPDNLTLGQQGRFCAEHHSLGEYFYKIFPKLLGGYAAMLTGLAVLVPTADNISSMQSAVNGNKGLVWGLFFMWLAVFVIWLLVSLAAFFRNPTRWPREEASWEPGRGVERWMYLLPTMIGLGIAIIFVAVFAYWFVNFKTWPNEWGTYLGIITALVFVVVEGFNVSGPVLEWFRNKQISMEHYLQLEKDGWLLLGAAVIFVVQCAIANKGKDQVLQSNGWLIAYILSLVMMGFGALRGVVRGAVRMIPKWQAQ